MAPWISWRSQRTDNTSETKHAIYQLAVSPVGDKVGPAPAAYVPDLDDKQQEQVKAIIEDYRARYAYWQKESEEANEREWNRVKPILTKDQLAILWFTDICSKSGEIKQSGAKESGSSTE
jgi:hypothetical protein